VSRVAEGRLDAAADLDLVLLQPYRLIPRVERVRSITAQTASRAQGRLLLDRGRLCGVASMSLVRFHANLSCGAARRTNSINNVEPAHQPLRAV
jgi:hypothetical protein